MITWEIYEVFKDKRINLYDRKNLLQWTKEGRRLINSAIILWQDDVAEIILTHKKRKEIFGIYDSDLAEIQSWASMRSRTKIVNIIDSLINKIKDKFPKKNKYERCIHLMNNRFYDEAISISKSMLDYKKDYKKWWWLHLSMCFSNLKKEKKALEIINNRLQISPNDYTAISWKANILKKSRNVIKSMEVFDQWAKNKDPLYFVQWIFGASYMARSWWDDQLTKDLLDKLDLDDKKNWKT